MADGQRAELPIETSTTTTTASFKDFKDNNEFQFFLLRLLSKDGNIFSKREKKINKKLKIKNKKSEILYVDGMV